MTAGRSRTTLLALALALTTFAAGHLAARAIDGGPPRDRSTTVREIGSPREHPSIVAPAAGGALGGLLVGPPPAAGGSPPPPSRAGSPGPPSPGTASGATPADGAVGGGAE